MHGGKHLSIFCLLQNGVQVLSGILVDALKCNQALSMVWRASSERNKAPLLKIENRFENMPCLACLPGVWCHCNQWIWKPHLCFTCHCHFIIKLHCTVLLFPALLALTHSPWIIQHWRLEQQSPLECCGSFQSVFQSHVGGIGKQRTVPLLVVTAIRRAMLVCPFFLAVCRRMPISRNSWATETKG